MKQQKLKQYLRECGCSIEAHSYGETFREVGNFILGKWQGTTFVVESIADGGLMLRVRQDAGWHAYYCSPCRACSNFMGFKVSAEDTVGFMPVEHRFIWKPGLADIGEQSGIERSGA